MVTQILQGNENNLEQIYSWKSSPGITKISSSFDHSFIHSSKTVLILDNESKESLFEEFRSSFSTLYRMDLRKRFQLKIQIHFK